MSLDHVAAAVSFRPFGPSPQHLRRIQKISRAVIRQREMEFHYQKLRGSRPVLRRLRPHHLLCNQDQWYVVGFDLIREAMRTSALPRISRITLTRRTFVRPAELSIHKHFGGGFGVFAVEGDDAISIRFDAFAARLVRERFWHTTQLIEEQPGGELSLSLRLNSLEEIERWVLSWGGHATVISPPDLIRRIRDVARSLTRRTRA